MSKTIIATISPEFLLWSETILIWSLACYGTILDPLSDERDFNWQQWSLILLVRSVLSGAALFALSHSIVLAFWLAIAVLAQALIRSSISPKWVAESEIAVGAASLSIMLAIIMQFNLTTFSLVLLRPERLSAVCIILATLILVVRGGTYIVRGCLKKAGTLPYTAEKGHPIDVKEFNRGRLIGNLERLILTIVVAAGSYAALGFLIAAKGLVRFEELKRDFVEYFLIGSLASVLIALLAGLIVRFVATLLWPELIALQMQPGGS